MQETREKNHREIFLISCFGAQSDFYRTVVQSINIQIIIFCLFIQHPSDNLQRTVRKELPHNHHCCLNNNTVSSAHV